MRPREDLVLSGGCAPIPTLDAKLPLTHFVAVGSEKISGQLSGLVISSFETEISYLMLLSNEGISIYLKFVFWPSREKLNSGRWRCA